MFRKQFKIKSNTQVKGSERKKIRSEIGNRFPQLTDEDLGNLLPNKECITTMKIVTHCGESVIVFSVDKIPVVFEVEKVMYPTVYMLWKFPNLIHTFITQPVVFSKLVGGADLMLPGVVLEEPYTIKSFGKLKKGELVSVTLTDNRAPIAVGTAALSSFDMYMSAKRGKGVHIVHYIGDLLCANIKMGPPNLGPPLIIHPQEGEEGSKVNVDVSCSYLGSADKVIDSNTLSESISPVLNEIHLESESVSEDAPKHEDPEAVDDIVVGDFGEFPAEQHELGNNVAPSEEQTNDGELKQSHETLHHIIEEDIIIEPSNEGCPTVDVEHEVTGPSVQESMDRLMEYCFLKALKTTARKLALPLLTSNFFKLHMIPACPKGDTLDVKKSTYKKLSKFLKGMEGKNVIEIRELTKGVESIVSVNYGNPILKQFVEDYDDDEALEASVKSNEINEMFVINASTLPLFRTFGYKKGESLMATSIRQHLTDYVTKNGLQSANDKRFVKLDHTLSSCLRLKEDEEVTWKELMTSCVEQMGNSYSIGQSGSVNKGKLKPIEITVATRTGNKKVTLISNLELYGISGSEFAKKCQHGVAASATITQLPGSKSAQVMVQGNQVIFLEKLLTGEYQIHKRFIRGLENAPKMKKPKRPISK